MGPRYSFRHGHFQPYAKFLLGAGEMNFSASFAHGGYFAMAPGGGLDWRLSWRWRVRGDYEYQIWPSAPGIAGQRSNGLTPQGFSVGLGFRVF